MKGNLKYFFPTRIQYIGIIAIFLLYLPCLAKSTQISSLNLSMALFDSNTMQSTQLSADDVVLSCEKVIASDKDNICTLLAKGHIHPDGESINVFYLLNPGIAQKSIKKGSEILAPTIRLNNQPTGVSGNGYQISIILDKNIKQDFVNSIRALEELEKKIDILDATLFESSKQKESLDIAIISIIDKMKFFKIIIREKTQPLSSQMIRQMNDEMDLSKSIITNLTDKRNKLTQAELESLDLIAANTDIRLKTLEESKGNGGIRLDNSEVLISVRTIDMKSGNPIHKLPVYFIGQALWANRGKYYHSFDTLSSPTVSAIAIGDYFIWSGKDPDSPLLSERKSLQVRPTAQNKPEDLRIYETTRKAQ
jgi:hypothetical protein